MWFVDGVLLVLLGVAAGGLVYTLRGFVREMEGHGTPGIESHWGGYGGGTGGWRLSPSLAYLIAMGVMAALLAVLARSLEERVSAVTVVSAPTHQAQ
jgi:hypothetical protein